VGGYPARRWARVRGGQDAADGAGADVVSEPGELALDVESAWGAVAGLPRLRFTRPLAEPDVRLSPHPALHSGLLPTGSTPADLGERTSVWLSSSIPGGSRGSGALQARRVWSQQVWEQLWSCLGAGAPLQALGQAPT